MKKLFIVILFTISLFAIEQKQEGVGWLDIFSYDDSSKKPRILIIGDSIVRQYTASVRNKLKTRYTFTRLSTSKSICSSEYLGRLSIAMTQPYRIILINNGLHDFTSSDNAYENSYKKTINFLIKSNPKSQIMLLTTTNVLGNKKRNNIVVKRNKILKKLSKIYNLPYIDLYSVVHLQKKLHKDAYHFTGGGS